MRAVIIFIMALSSASVFAQTSNDKLVKTCVNSAAGIEMFVYERLDFFGRPVQSRVKKRDLYRVEIYEKNIAIFETNYAFLSEKDSEFYSARGMALILNYPNSGRLYLSNHDRYGRSMGPLFNALKVNCRNF